MVGTAYLPVSAGSPGPLDRNTPSGLSARMSSAVAVAGTTFTAQPASASRRKMLRFTPKSSATTLKRVALSARQNRSRASRWFRVQRNPSPRGYAGHQVHAVDAGQAAACALSASRSNLPSGSWAITALGMPFSRISAVKARVSTPPEADDVAGLQPCHEVVLRRENSTGRSPGARTIRPRAPCDARHDPRSRCLRHWRRHCRYAGR